MIRSRAARRAPQRRPWRDAAPAGDAPPLTIQLPVDVRHVALTIGAIAGTIWLLRTTQEVLIPFVVSGLLFYALDPFVDRLQKWRVPRLVGATFVLVGLVAGSAAVAYYLSDQVIAVVEQVPRGARQLRDELRRTSGEPGAIEKVQQAADAIDRTAAESAGAVAGAARRDARADRAAAVSRLGLPVERRPDACRRPSESA